MSSDPYDPNAPWHVRHRVLLMVGGSMAAAFLINALVRWLLGA